LEFIVTLHAPVPVHAPLQPANVEPAAAVGVSVTIVPVGKLAEQVVGQLIPEGELDTVPLPVPASVTLSKKFVGVVLKVAVTACAAFIVTLQVPVPEQAPLQPANIEPVPGAAVNVTMVPLAKLAEQAVGQLTPAGLLVTMPLPVPASVTVKLKFATTDSTTDVDPYVTVQLRLEGSVGRLVTASWPVTDPAVKIVNWLPPAGTKPLIKLTFSTPFRLAVPVRFS
jgi:hypothetical protein